MQQGTLRMIGQILLVLLLGCGFGVDESLAAVHADQAATEAAMAVSPGNEPFSGQSPAPDDFLAALGRQGRTTRECFQLRPGGAGDKRARARRCEPQSLPFARCRSGIDSCRLGRENGPLTWFACEKERGNTSLVPRPGSILILGANKGRNMPTGHVAYVEEVAAHSGTTYRLVFTHTNHDRRCSLESNIEATYDSIARSLDIHGGAWQSWGKGLPVAGFILE